VPGDGPHLRGVIALTGDRIANLEEAFRDCETGRPSRRPILEVTIPSTLDDSLCPAGHDAAHEMLADFKRGRIDRARRHRLQDLSTTRVDSGGLEGTPGDSVDDEKRLEIAVLRQKSCAISQLVNCG
jgi:phytoene dehydrogenase-like protein